MTITTKYNIADTLWFMSNNKPTNSHVHEINIKINSYGKTTMYEMNSYTHYQEKDLYKSKEELLASL